MDANNAFKAQPQSNPNPNSNYGPLQQQPYNPGWSMPMPAAGSGYSSSAAMPPMPAQLNQPMGIGLGSYPHAPTATPVTVPMPPQSNYNPPVMPHQSNYNPPVMPHQNNYNPVPTQNHFTPIVSYPAPPAMSYLQPSHSQQPRLSVGSASIPMYNPHPQQSSQMSHAYPQQPGSAVPFGVVIGKDEQKRMKKMMKEQEKMEKKHAKANKYFH